MPKDSKKAIAAGVGLGLVGLFGWLLSRKAKVVPPPPPPGLANLYGKVTDAVTGNAIANVLVNLNGTTIYTDGGGNYALLNVQPGSYSLTFQKEGYQTAVY